MEVAGSVPSVVRAAAAGKGLPAESLAPRMPWWDRTDFQWDSRLMRAPVVWRPYGRKRAVEEVRPNGRVVRRLSWRQEVVPLPATAAASQVTLRVVSALAMWQVMTTEQIQAVCGVTPENLSNRVLRPLFRAGMVERGDLSQQEAGYRAVSLWRLVWDRPLTGWLWGLSPEERLHVTLGRESGSPGRGHAKHAVLCAELGLRAQEVPGSPWAAVLGEPVAEARRLLGVDSDVHGDVVLVRGDGLRVVVELVNNKQTKAEEKMLAWARLLAGVEWQRSGTVVVFLSAGLAEDGSDRRMLERLFEDAVDERRMSTRRRAFTDAEVRNGRSQVLVANWRDWFPAPGVVGPEFPALPCRANPSGGRGGWVTVRVGASSGPGSHPGPVRGPDGRPHVSWGAPIVNARRMPAVPRWAGSGEVVSRLDVPVGELGAVTVP